MRIRTEGYLHVGSGLERLEIPPADRLKEELRRYGWNAAVERLSREISRGFMEMVLVNGRPCVPGSSVKGNVRSRIELSIVARNGAVRSCYVRASPPQLASDRRAWRHRAIWGNEVLREDRGPPCDLTRGSSVCLVCDLFGTAGLKGLIEFGDFVGEDVELEPVEGQFGLKLMAAKPGSQFIGNVSFTNLRPWELGLLLFGMGIRNGPVGEQVLLGRLKYVGAIGNRPIGRVRYVLDAIELSQYSEPLFDLKPGQVRSGESLSGVIVKLMEELRKEMGEELRWSVKEVR
ncbi:MAG: RAMP superfamily CRISPR-associated protein [Aigarchaeota archaeon]|nr:RAMP superfamily CRISPR-associated protein [Candidatus Calditenuis fumarioli]